MKITNHHIVWKEGKNLSLPDLLSRSLTTATQDEHRLETIEITGSNKLFMTHNQHTQPMQCPYAISKVQIHNKYRNYRRITTLSNLLTN